MNGDAPIINLPDNGGGGPPQPPPQPPPGPFHPPPPFQECLSGEPTDFCVGLISGIVDQILEELNHCTAICEQSQIQCCACLSQASLRIGLAAQGVIASCRNQIGPCVAGLLDELIALGTAAGCNPNWVSPFLQQIHDISQNNPPFVFPGGPQPPVGPPGQPPFGPQQPQQLVTIPPGFQGPIFGPPTGVIQTVINPPTGPGGQMIINMISPPGAGLGQPPQTMIGGGGPPPNGLPPGTQCGVIQVNPVPSCPPVDPPLPGGPDEPGTIIVTPGTGTPEEEQTEIWAPPNPITPTSALGIGFQVCSPTSAVNAAELLSGMANPQVMNYVDSVFAFGGTLAGNNVPDWAVGYATDKDSAAKIRELTAGWAIGSKVSDMKAAELFKFAGCMSPAYIADQFTWMLAGFGGGLIGTPHESVTAGIDYALKYRCPYKIPSQEEFARLYTHGYIGEDMFRIMTRFNGQCIDWEMMLADSSQTWTDIRTAIMANRRGLINDATLQLLMQRNGVPSVDQQNLMFLMTEQRPALSDILRFMVRDADDASAVQAGNLDFQFTEKYSGQLRKWSEDQGIPEDIARYFWRSHWELPSPNQIYEFLHRLRPDRPRTGQPFDDINFTPTDAEKILQQDDKAPGYIRHLLAVSYSPLTRVDTRRAYEIGALSLDGVYNSYRDLGYDDATANVLKDFTRKISGPKRAVANGEMPEAKVKQLFMAETISAQSAIERLTRLEIPSEVAAAKVSSWELEKQAVRSKEIISAAKRRFLQGDFTPEQLIQELINSGIDASQAISISRHMTQLRSLRSKVPPTNTLCKWFGNGLLTMEDYQRRLSNLGWQPEDVIRIVGSCVIDVTKQRQRELKELEAELKRAAKEKEKLAQEMKERLQGCRDRALPFCNPDDPEK